MQQKIAKHQEEIQDLKSQNSQLEVSFYSFVSQEKTFFNFPCVTLFLTYSTYIISPLPHLFPFLPSVHFFLSPFFFTIQLHHLSTSIHTFLFLFSLLLHLPFASSSPYPSDTPFPLLSRFPLKLPGKTVFLCAGPDSAAGEGQVHGRPDPWPAREQLQSGHWLRSGARDSGKRITPGLLLSNSSLITGSDLEL